MRQLRGDRAGVGRAIAQKPGRALVRERAVVDGDVLVDRRADDRVHERQRRLIGEDLSDHELACGDDGELVGQSGQRRRQRQLRVVAQHGRGPRHRHRVPALPCEPHEHGTRGGPRGEFLDPGQVRDVRRHALGAQRLEQLGEQQRVAPGRLVPGVREGLVRSQELGRGALAQRERVHGDRERITDDLRQQVRARVPLDRPDAAEDRDGQAVEPADQVGQVAQRGLVGPLQIVDGEQDRRGLREVEGQPVEPVQDRERRVLARDARRGSFEHLARAVRHRLAAADHVLEQLPHDPEGQLLLEFAAARGEHVHAGLGRLAPGLGDQPRLPDARGAFDHEQARAAGGGVFGQRAERRQLALALEQGGHAAKP